MSWCAWSSGHNAQHTEVSKAAPLPSRRLQLGKHRGKMMKGESEWFNKIMQSEAN